MDIGLILIATILCLGGVIATLGDRIGMRVGKARLSLFNLRPRQTATVVSILTGSVISASTLGLLLIASEQLRKSLFEFEDIQRNLAEVRQALADAQAAKTDMESALDQVSQQKMAAESNLNDVNASLKDAIEREAATQERLQQTQGQLTQVSQQALRLRSEIERLQQERQSLLRRQAEIRRQIAQRDNEIRQRNQQLAERNQQIAQREEQLRRLETQQTILAEEIRRLEAEFIKLRSGSVAVSRNQTLALLLTSPDSAEAARREIERVLMEANRIALRAIWPDAPTDVQILRISPLVVEQTLNQILGQENYVVRVASSGNYIVGEPCVLSGEEPCVDVDLQTQVNRIVFQPGETLAKVRIETAYPPTGMLVEKIRALLVAAQVQASLEGIIIDDPRVAGGLTEPLIQFVESIQNYGQPLEIAAVAAQPIFTTGPLFLDLVALDEGQPVFRTTLQEGS